MLILYRDFLYWPLFTSVSLTDFRLDVQGFKLDSFDDKVDIASPADILRNRIFY